VIVLTGIIDLWYSIDVLADTRRIGLVAVEGEAQPLLAMFQGAARDRQGEVVLHVTDTGNRRLILAEVLQGPVHAALGAQALIARHGARCLICFGSAGALDPSLAQGEVIIGQRAVAHDAGLFLGSRFLPGGVMVRDTKGRIARRRWFDASHELVHEALAVARASDWPARVGTVASGNQAVFASRRRDWLRHTFDALAVDMETAAVAQVAAGHNLPWVAVRAISDAAGDEQIVDYDRLQRTVDDDVAEWRRQLARGWYLMSHPFARRRLRRLQQGISLAAMRAAHVVEAMLMGEV
jgi:adenosylhomocysteine nucleosidase